jgi:hypothetical protein
MSPPASAEPIDVIVLPDSEATGCPPAVLPPVRIYDAEPIIEQIAVVDERSLPFWLFHSLCSALEWLFGLFSMLVGLSILAVIPLAQLASLGYLLEVSGRIARKGKLSEGFVGMRKAARIGSIFLGTWLMLWPLRMISDLWYSAQLVDQGSWIARGWRVALLACFAVTCAHIVLAWFCGGKLRHFFWPLLAVPSLVLWALRALISTQVLSPIGGPIRRSFSQRFLADLGRHVPLTDWFPPAILWAAIRRGRMYSRARDAVCDFIVSLRLPYYFWLGARGFAGTIAWLFVPVILLVGTTKLPEGPGGLAFLLGFPLLCLVLLYLPFMQAHFAAENRFVAMFEVGKVRQQFRRAPLAFLFALFITLAFALPLYLFKIEIPPHQANWWIAELSFLSMTSLIFVAFMWPARFLAGWALARGRKREKPRFILARWTARLLELPIIFIYALMVYVSQYTSWYGAWSLFEQHAFLVPVPFLSL